MDRDGLPEDPAKQWDVLLYVIAYEEKKIDRRTDGAFETLTYFFNHVGIRKIFSEWMAQMTACYDKQMSDEDTATKSDAISYLWRQRGNIKFKCGLYEESHNVYTKSVVYADKQSAAYSVALANRAAASIKLKKFKDSLQDIQRALNHKYPPELQHKLYLRRAECYYQMGQKQNSIDSIKQAIKHNNLIKLKGLTKVEFEKNVRSLREKLAEINYDCPPDEVILPKLYLGENVDFKDACDAVELKQNDQCGRHVIVKEPIRRGDVIFSESPYASIKLPDSCLPHSNYCSYCCSNEFSMIGCSDCSRVLYCDEACQYLGNEIYHRWECAGVRAKIFDVIGTAHLAFRVMLKYAHEGFPRLPESVPAPTTAAELLASYARVDKIGIYKKNSPPFLSMFNLLVNLDNSSNCGAIQYSLSSTMLVLYLETHYAEFFDYFSKRVGYPLPMSEMKLLCAALIFRTIAQLITNAHTIMELDVGQSPDMPIPFTTTAWREIGSGVYPSASMMNHSCEPNITNLYFKNRLFVKAVRELYKGSEVLHCYGPHYARTSTKERRDALRIQYGFHCKCLACIDETRKDFVSLFSAYACPSCKGPVPWVGTRTSCHQCPNKFPLQKAENAAETCDAMHALAVCHQCHLGNNVLDCTVITRKACDLTDRALRAKTKEERCDRMVQCYRITQQVLYRHHDLFRTIAADLAMAYAAVGEFSKSIDLIKQNIQSFEYQYGSFSMEVTNEVRKLANLMLARNMKYLDNPDYDDRQPVAIRDWIRETLNILKKADQLMELNFGTWEPVYKALKNNEEILENVIAGPRFHDDADCFNYCLQKLNIV